MQAAILENAKIRRSAFMQLTLVGDTSFSLDHIFSGAPLTRPSSCWKADSALSGKTVLLSDKLVDALRSISSITWTDCIEALKLPCMTASIIHHLAQIGLVLIQPAEPGLQRFLDAEEKLTSSAWHPMAPVYHFCTKWQDVQLQFNMPSNAEDASVSLAAKESTFRRFTETHGLPPNHFHEREDAIGKYELPIVEFDSDLTRLMCLRRTKRVFSRNEVMSLEKFSKLIRYAFGPHGIYQVSPDVHGLGKLSPSGGGLHPTEVYVLVMAVEGHRPGIYHYNQQQHRLDCIQEFDEHAARERANIFSAGQQYPASASALFILTSRFYRNFWKYRNHPRAYPVLYMDIAHLSQTFYLLCQELELGAFFTAAINASNVESVLKIDGFEEGALAILGCGTPEDSQLGLEAAFEKFMPRSVQEEIV